MKPKVLKYKKEATDREVTLVTVYRKKKIFCEIECLDASSYNIPEEIQNWLDQNGYEDENFEIKEIKPKVKKGEILVSMMKKNPKPDAKSYQISTIQDMINAVTSENIDSFLKDFENVLRVGIIFKENSPTNSLAFPSFEWIDD
jgi:galactitol-specific phosphotransferase system IIB component